MWAVGHAIANQYCVLNAAVHESVLAVVMAGIDVGAGEFVTPAAHCMRGASSSSSSSILLGRQ